jgi:hypothetical protein
MSIEYMLARLTAQTGNLDPRIPGGGIPELTAADISLIAAAAPHMSYHALMAKYCDDQISEREILAWAHRTSLDEWFTNPAHATTPVQARQLNRLAELTVLAWINPQLPHGTSIPTRAAYIGANHDTFRHNFQSHYAFLTGELGYLERIGIIAAYKFKGRKDDQE